MSHLGTKTLCLSTCHCVTLPGAYLATAEHGVVKQCRERPRHIILLRTEKYDIFTGINVKYTCYIFENRFR